MKLAGLHKVIITYKMLASDFFPDDLRSDQLRDPTIISLWGNIKMLPVSHKPTKTTHFLQDHSH